MASNNYSRTRKEIYDAIETIINGYEGRSVPISRIVYLLTTKYGCSDLMIKKRLDVLQENDIIEINGNEVTPLNYVKKEAPKEEFKRGW